MMIVESVTHESYVNYFNSNLQKVEMKVEMNLLIKSLLKYSCAAKLFMHRTPYNNINSIRHMRSLFYLNTSFDSLVIVFNHPHIIRHAL